MSHWKMVQLFLGTPPTDHQIATWLLGASEAVPSEVHQESLRGKCAFPLTSAFRPFLRAEPSSKGRAMQTL